MPIPEDRESRYDGATVTPDDVLELWIGSGAPLAKSAQWWTKDPAFDQELLETFGQTHELASRGALDTWKTTPRGRLALVILLDQFSRNMYRNTPRSFAQDARACALALEAIVTGDEQALSTIERSFLYMPLMHAEDVDLQHKCVAAFERLRDDAPIDLRAYVENTLGYAHKHAEVIERFGRFPHRNDILGRASRPDELEFLTQPGSSF